MIPLFVREAVITAGAVTLGLTPMRPCLVGELVGPLTAYELDPGIVVVGRESTKAGHVPQVIRVDAASPVVTGATLPGGFQLVTPEGLRTFDVMEVVNDFLLQQELADAS